MCSNYRSVTRLDRLLTFFGVEYGKDEAERDVFPLGTSPFIRLSVEGQEGGRPAMIAEEGMFGLLPNFATELRYGTKTYNCRSETVTKLPSFRDAWRKSQRCIIPAEYVYEPNYESGAAVRWRIFQDGDVPLGIAGLYTQWRGADGNPRFTFTMITVNCDAHPFYKQFHKPGDEKRMPIFLARDEYLPWLTCSVADAPKFFRQWTGVLHGTPDPLRRAAAAPKPPKSGPPTAAPPVQDDLF